MHEMPSDQTDSPHVCSFVERSGLIFMQDLLGAASAYERVMGQKYVERTGANQPSVPNLCPVFAGSFAVTS